MVTVDARYALSRPSRMWLKSENPASDAARRERGEEVALDPATVIRCMNWAAST